jgi:hypothetical protein
MLSHTLHLAVYSAPGGQLMHEFGPISSGLRFGFNEHGAATCSWFTACTLADGFRYYATIKGKHCEVGAFAFPIWTGRIEDVSFDEDGLSITAFGYQRALSDAPYTGFWSKTNVDDFEEVPATAAGANPKMFEMSKDGSLFFGLKKNATYAITGDTGAYFWQVPNGSATQIKRISFDYSYVLPAVNRRMRVAVMNTDRTSAVSYDTTVTGTASGSFSQDVSANPRDRVEIQLYNISGAATTYAGESGANYLNITNLRITCSGATIYADEIAVALASFTNGVNSTQLSTASALIQSPALDLKDESYEDRYPADILNDLVALGDNQTPPRLWEWGVSVDQTLYLRPRGTGRAWYVEVGSLKVDTSLDDLRNSAYAVYQDAYGNSTRTSTSSDPISAVRYGLTRRIAADASTTNSTQAGVHRDVALAEGIDPRPRSKIIITKVFDEYGAHHHPWRIRPGDTITVRNISPAVSADVDRVRAFVVAEADFDADKWEMAVTPERSTLSLDVLVAAAMRANSRKAGRR